MSTARRLGLQLGLCAAACALAAGTLAAAPAGAFSWVSYPALVAQIRSGPVIRVIVNRGGGDAEIKFRNLYEWKARFAPAQERALVDLVQRRHIHLIFASRPRAHAKPPAARHHLRYIAAGVLALALAAALALLWRRSRARRRAPAPQRTS